MKKIILSFIIAVSIVIFSNTVYGFTIVVDPGHGGNDTGAIGNNNIYERDIANKVSDYLIEYLSKYDITIYKTHEVNENPEIIDRGIFVRSKKADLGVSLHFNDAESETDGAEVWVSHNTSLDKYNKNTTELGNKILNNISKLGIRNRGVKPCANCGDSTDVYTDGTRADYLGFIRYCMRGCKIDNGVISPTGAIPANIQKGEGVPAILIEHCFVKWNDYKYINSDSKLKALAEADGKAIVEYYNLQLKSQQYENTPFTDVYKGKWYCNAIEYVYKNNIMKGYSDTIFAPNDKVTRGMLVTILYRMEGEPSVSGKNKFPDVQDSTKYYYKAVKWASDNKLVNGYDNGNFGPTDDIQRQQLAVILNKYAKYKGKATTQTNDLKSYKDTDKISSYAVNQMKWAVGAKVITGNSDGTLNPKGEATRAEVAAMMEKYCKNVGR